MRFTKIFIFFALSLFIGFLGCSKEQKAETPKQERVEKTGENEFLVSVKAKPVEGKATEAVVKALAEYFNISKSRIALIKGQTSRFKVFDILG